MEHQKTTSWNTN